MNVPFQQHFQSDLLSQLSNQSDQDLRVVVVESLSDRPPSSASSFVDFQISKMHNTILSEVKRSEITQFVGLLSKRIDYLGGLVNLQRNWVSGVSEKPSQSSINASRALLQYFSNYIKNRNIPRLPKLLIGPIPTGGVSLEFHINENTALFITIRNEQAPEIEVKYEDYYFNYIAEPQALSARLMDNYEAITEK